jgi:di/tricarboxylate transporter
MTGEIIFVLCLVVATVVLFATERFRVDLVALMIVAILLVTGILTPQEGLQGFSNIATVTVTAMFVLSGGLLRTGAVNGVATWLSRVGSRSPGRITITLVVTVGLLSAFINNTAVVAIFLPIVLTVARDTRISASKLLIPLSFSAMLGGLTTLVGTSTNILVASMAVNAGEPEFGMFEFTLVGTVMLIVGGLYLVLVGVRLTPDRRIEGDLLDTFAMSRYLTDIMLKPDSQSVGERLESSHLVQDLDIDVLEIRRDERRMIFPPGSTVLRAGDTLRVRGNIEKIRKSQMADGISLAENLDLDDSDLTSDETVLVEAVIAPGAWLEGRSVKSVRFRSVYGASVLAIRHRAALAHENLLEARLAAGDTLLLELRQERIDQLRAQNDFVIVTEAGATSFRVSRKLQTIGIVAAVIALAAFGILPIVTSAILGCIGLVLTGCVTLEEAYKSIEWKVIFLLAGALSLGLALEKTGAARLISDTLIGSIGHLGPVAVVSAIYLFTSLLTNAMSNTATAAMMVPIAIATAHSMGVDPRPLLMAVAFGASAAFMTPIGYQTNTLIYGPGQYRFVDFLKVGTPLNLLIWLVATVMIPLVWPL